eukprot:3721329-Amphidinium_carterae.3
MATMPDLARGYGRHLSVLLLHLHALKHSQSHQISNQNFGWGRLSQTHSGNSGHGWTVQAKTAHVPKG